MLLDIVILPPENLRKRLGKQILRATKGMPRIFVVDNKKFIHHMSLFHLRTQKSKLPMVTKIVAAAVKDFRSTIIRSTAFLSHESSLWFPLSSNATLRSLNKRIVRDLHKLKTGAMPWTGDKSPTVVEQANRKRYGTEWNIGKTFIPHITMARLKNPSDAKKATKVMKGLEFNFKADTVAITEVNFWHQVTKVLKTYKLK